MQFNIEKTVSNFVESQFPQFYLEEGPNFVLFMKAYYEWMESEGQAIQQARNLFDTRDIDNTLNDFLEHFQKKYLYGIPFNVIINKRFLLKHILDVYRSKGTINCYKLLFKLIYNQDVEIYLPGNDILKPSDGTWVQPKYIEVTNDVNLNNFVGQTVVGLSSNTSAVVEDYIQEPINQNILASLYLTDIMPKGGTFFTGEKVLIKNQRANTAAVAIAPIVLGSMSSMQIINGGQQFNIGDILKIADRDVVTGDVISHGVDGQVRVTGLSRAQGALYFYIVGGGTGFTSNASIFVYSADGNGSGGSFSIGGISYTNAITYDTDLIVDYANLTLNATTFGFTGNNSANVTTPIQNALKYNTQTFGSIYALSNIQTGNGYTSAPNIFVRSTQLAQKILAGTLSYTTSSNTVTGTGTAFTYYFSNNDAIYLQANSSNSASKELHIIKQVVDDTHITLYGPPKYSSTAYAVYKNAPIILPSNFDSSDPVMYSANGSVVGLNANVSSLPSTGNNVVATVSALNSGKGYVDGETVVAYRFGGLNPLNIVNGGSNYSNGDTLIFNGGGLSASPATGNVVTWSNGNIKEAPLTFSGSGYSTTPSIVVRSNTGTGAVLTTTVTQYNTASQVIGKIVKGSNLGVKPGYWTTTRGFLNSDKYIQDSYFYQDFSYQIKVAATLDKYKDILYNTFHTAGSELFGKFYEQINEISQTKILYEVSSSYNVATVKADSTLVTSDNSVYTVDILPV
jgi:hypothetical protein